MGWNIPNQKAKQALSLFGCEQAFYQVGPRIGLVISGKYYECSERNWALRLIYAAYCWMRGCKWAYVRKMAGLE